MAVASIAGSRSMMSYRVLTGEAVLTTLFNYSGMTYADLQEHFYPGLRGATQLMSLIDCLRALQEVRLIKIDGIEDNKIREFISYCEYPSDWNDFHETEHGPEKNKFRTSDAWRKIHGAMLEGLQYTTHHRTICYPTFGMPKTQDNTYISDIFVMMPFRVDMAPVYEILRSTAANLGQTIRRADEFSSSSPIITDIWSAIWGAKIAVADCTGKNPNVFYELGMAHTIGRPVVLITQSKDDIPFDVRHIRYIEYQLDGDGLDRFSHSLEGTFKACLREYRGNPW
jgi:hypothetical protein